MNSIPIFVRPEPSGPFGLQSTCHQFSPQALDHIMRQQMPLSHPSPQVQAQTLPPTRSPPPSAAGPDIKGHVLGWLESEVTV